MKNDAKITLLFVTQNVSRTLKMKQGNTACAAQEVVNETANTSSPAAQ